jgi:flagellar hook protein FlgE
MGIFSAITTAITGLKAQSTALDHISGNIANSGTIGYKRTETSFADVVPERAPNRQSAGAVLSSSRATNDVQGEIVTAGEETYLSVNGDGYFIVAQVTGQSDTTPTFSGTDLYTRRGDFQLDKNGYLVNGAGYYLKGLAIDGDTGNVTGSTPEVIQITSDLVPAQQTTELTYRANLARFPLTSNADPEIAGSELFNYSAFTNDPTAATVTATQGFVRADDNTDFIENSVSGGAITAYDETGAPVNIQLRWTKLTSTTASQTALPLTGGLAGGDPISNAAEFAVGDIISFQDTGGTSLGNITITGAMTVDQFATAVNNTITNRTAFYDSNGTLRFAGIPGTITNNNATFAPQTLPAEDRWQLFYNSDSLAGGALPQWRRIEQDYVFGSNGQLNPPVTDVTQTLQINGITLSNLLIRHGTEGVTQFADSDGNVQVTGLNQNGFASGELTGVSVSSAGRVELAYSNGQIRQDSEVVLAAFSGDNALQKRDGGVYAATNESGEPILGATGNIIASSTEGSNVDIADEFTKLIVTQQAYAASTRILTTADEMLQETLRIVN